MPTDIKMPQLGESVTEGTIGRWLKRPGERVEKYEALLEVTTDKVDTEVPAPVAGIVREILVSEGETVRVGTLLALLDDERRAPRRRASLRRRAESGQQAVARSPRPLPPRIRSSRRWWRGWRPSTTSISADQRHRAGRARHQAGSC